MAEGLGFSRASETCLTNRWIERDVMGDGFMVRLVTDWVLGTIPAGWCFRFMNYWVVCWKNQNKF